MTMQKELAQIRREFRLTKVWAFATSAIVIIMGLSGFAQKMENRRFEEIDVERINIVEKDGKLRMVISNRERQHPGMVDGKLMRRENGRPPGMIFFNHLGDECGGLIFDENGGKGHFLSLTFDKSKNDQTIGLQHLESDNGQYFAGLRVWERPNSALSVLATRIEAVKKLPEGAERALAFKGLENSGELGADRITIGRLRNKSAIIDLSDPKGNTRLRFLVDSLGMASIQFLDESGRVVRVIPD